MTHETIELTKLDVLLEQERTFLLAGDLEGLGTLLPVKEQMMDLLLENPNANRDEFLPLESKLQRNQLLLDGALDGIRSVADRLAALRQVRTALDTYDAQGRKQRVMTETKSRIEKRS